MSDKEKSESISSEIHNENQEEEEDSKIEAEEVEEAESEINNEEEKEKQEKQEKNEKQEKAEKEEKEKAEKAERIKKIKENLEKEVLNVLSYQNEIVKFNVSGEHFTTTRQTLTKHKDSLFYKIASSTKFDLSKEIYFDRSSQFFNDILDFLRTGLLNLKKYTKTELELIKTEADYYDLFNIYDQIDDILKEPVFISYTVNETYVSGEITVGTNKLEDVSDRDLNTGICANTPGLITFELKYETTIESIEIGGFRGNSTLWSSSNGAGALIEVSKDNKTWELIGNVPSSFASSIVKVELEAKELLFKYIRLSHTSYLGIGYFKLIKFDK